MIINTGKGRQLIDISGQRFERWTVLRFAGKKNGQSMFLCRCDCGTEKEVSSSSLQWGGTKSCGCLRAEVSSTKAKTHGKSGTPEHRIWKNLHTRCYNKNAKSFASYGGRGITICDRWLHSFPNFLEDMGTRPSPKHSIERRNNDGPYSPDNCYWATDHQQRRNKRTNFFIEHDGLRLTLTDWAKKTGLGITCIRLRLVKLGWPVAKALTTPSQQSSSVKPT